MPVKFKLAFSNPLCKFNGVILYLTNSCADIHQQIVESALILDGVNKYVLLGDIHAYQFINQTEILNPLNIADQPTDFT